MGQRNTFFYNFKHRFELGCTTSLKRNQKCVLLQKKVKKECSESRTNLKLETKPSTRPSCLQLCVRTKPLTQTFSSSSLQKIELNLVFKNLKTGSGWLKIKVNNNSYHNNVKPRFVGVEKFFDERKKIIQVLCVSLQRQPIFYSF